MAAAAPTRNGLLDLKTRDRTSLLPWRGQFSPGLVERLLPPPGVPAVVLDPFVGSGTTLFEAQRLGHPSVGTEINPAAVELARIAQFGPMAAAERHDALAKTGDLIGRYVDDGLWGGAPGKATTAEAIADVLSQPIDAEVRNLLRVSVMLAMGDRRELTMPTLHRAFAKVSTLVRGLPPTTAGCLVLQADARSVPLPDRSVDFVLTSPPYVNVFNYHQNYRPAMELMGDRPLEISAAELGSNRKHRSNRFLTVIQYAIDMVSVLREMHRLLRADGYVTVVIGRESRVRGVPFENGRLFSELAAASALFSVQRWEERRFTGRFGGVIVEDVLTLRSRSAATAAVTGREIGSEFLRAATQVPPDAAKDLASAIEAADTVKPSPLLELSTSELASVPAWICERSEGA